MSEPKRMTDERLRFTREGLADPVPYSNGSAREEIGNLLAHIDALTAEPSRVEDTEVEKMCLYLSYVDSYGKKLNADGDRAADLIRRLAAAKASAEAKLEGALKITDETVERCAKAMWNATPLIIEKLELTTASVREYQRRGVAVLWDDEDMRERDRELTRGRVRAALSQLDQLEAAGG